MTAGAQFRLRFSLIDGPELRCPHCCDWWPITPECWRPNRWWICRACDRERSRLHAALRQHDPEFREKSKERQRRYRAWLREHCPGYLPAYERSRLEQRRVYARGRRAALKETP